MRNPERRRGPWSTPELSQAPTAFCDPLLVFYIICFPFPPLKSMIFIGSRPMEGRGFPIIFPVIGVSTCPKSRNSKPRKTKNTKPGPGQYVSMAFVLLFSRFFPSVLLPENPEIFMHYALHRCIIIIIIITSFSLINCDFHRTVQSKHSALFLFWNKWITFSQSVNISMW